MLMFPTVRSITLRKIVSSVSSLKRLGSHVHTATRRGEKNNYLILHVRLYLMMAYIEAILSLTTVNSQRLAKKLTQKVISCLPKAKKSKRKKVAAGELQKEQKTL